MRRKIIILGSTGSIGTQALEVVSCINRFYAEGVSPVGFDVVGLAAGRNVELLLDQAELFGVSQVAVAEETASGERPGGRGRTGVKVLRGGNAAEDLVRSTPCDLVLSAMVGSAGLPATLAAVELGRDVALANKEALVAAGTLVVGAARRTGAKLLPVDSEHSAIWQCLGTGPGAGTPPPMECGPEVTRIVLTASGGPFRTWSKERIEDATPEQALKHPTWSMGKKVTIDSASLTNKALEVIEAHWLFGVEPERIGVVIHPQSVVHSFVEYADGSVMAQLGEPDMRTPIQYAVCHPHRTRGPARRLDFRSLTRLDFEEPDRERFPALGAAYGVLKRGGTAGAVFNAANEEVVKAFLQPGSTVRFGAISALTLGAMEHITSRPVRTLADVEEAEGAAREYVRSRV